MDRHKSDGAHSWWKSIKSKKKFHCQINIRQSECDQYINWVLICSPIFRFVFPQRVRWYAMAATPFLTFYVAGLIFSADTLFIIKLFLLACLYGVAHTIGKTMFDDHLMTLLPLSVYMATKLWFYVTWLGYIAPTVSTLTTILFLLSSGTLWYCFLKAWRGDPGVIKPTQEQRFRVSFIWVFWFWAIELMLCWNIYRLSSNCPSGEAVDLSRHYFALGAWCVVRFDRNIVPCVIVVWHALITIVPGSATALVWCSAFLRSTEISFISFFVLRCIQS